MLSATQFHTISRERLSAIYDALELAYEAGSIDDLELEDGLLTIVTATGKSFIVSAHAPSLQIWLASPIAGGLHFVHGEGDWSLANGDRLGAVLSRELATQGVECAL